MKKKASAVGRRRSAVTTAESAAKKPASTAAKQVSEKATPRGRNGRRPTADGERVSGRNGRPPTADGERVSGRNGRRPTADGRRLLALLEATYPDASCALTHRNAFELLAATILSAQCTDKRVNMVTPELFAAYPDAQALAGADQTDVERIIQSTGFFRSKAKSLIGMARALVERHGGEVPCDMAALTRLPGVGRKTANVVLGNAFGVNEGIVVDTHVGRLSRRLGLTRNDDPVKVEQDLVPLFPRERWTALAHYLIEHGRATCDARKPRCGACPLRDLCPSASP